MRTITGYIFIVSLALTGFSYPLQGAGTTMEAPGSELIVNADALRRDNVYAQFLLYKNTLHQLRGVKTQKYKEVKRKYRATRYLYRKYQTLAQETEKKLRKIRKNNPEILQYLQELQGSYPGKIQAFVGSKVRFSSRESLGDTYIRFLPTQKNIARLNIQQEYELGILVLAPQNNAIKITLATDADLPDSRHELGHFAYVVAKTQTYYQYLRSQHHVHERSHDGHSHADPSGVWAMNFEKSSLPE